MPPSVSVDHTSLRLVYSAFDELMVFKIVGMHTADLDAPRPTSGTTGDGLYGVQDVMHR